MSVIPKLEPHTVKTETDSTDSNSNNSHSAQSIHRFINGQTVPSNIALQSTWNGTIGLWAADKSIIEPSFEYPASFVAALHEQYKFPDFVIDIENFSMNKIKICGGHQRPGYKEISKRGTLSKIAKLIDADNWELVKYRLRLREIRIGIIIFSDRDCTSFRPLCQIETFMKSTTSSTATKTKPKIVSGLQLQSSNPFVNAKRSMFAERAGLELRDIEFMINNHEELSNTLQRIHAKYPAFKNCPKSATKWAKLLISEKKTNINKVPYSIKKCMQREQAAIEHKPPKPPMNHILTELGIEKKQEPEEEEQSDDDTFTDSNDIDIANLRKKWMKEAEEKFKEEYLAKLRSMNNM